MGQAGSTSEPNPISEFLRRGQSIDELRALFRLMPWQLERRDRADSKGHLPVHAALRHGASPEEMWLLMQAWPQALRKINGDGCIPLHVASAVATADVVQFLANERPEALEEKYHVGRLPLHLAVAHVTEDIVRVLVKAGPRPSRRELTTEMDGSPCTSPNKCSVRGCEVPCGGLPPPPALRERTTKEAYRYTMLPTARRRMSLFSWPRNAPTRSGSQTTQVSSPLMLRRECTGSTFCIYWRALLNKFNRRRLRRSLPAFFASFATSRAPNTRTFHIGTSVFAGAAPNGSKRTV